MHKTYLEIANNASKKHIKNVALSLDIPEETLIVYGNDKAKIHYDFFWTHIQTFHNKKVS